MDGSRCESTLSLLLPFCCCCFLSPPNAADGFIAWRMDENINDDRCRFARRSDDALVFKRKEEETEEGFIGKTVFVQLLVVLAVEE